MSQLGCRVEAVPTVVARANQHQDRAGGELLGEPSDRVGCLAHQIYACGQRGGLRSADRFRIENRSHDSHTTMAVAKPPSWEIDR